MIPLARPHILVTGSEGQLGRALQILAAQQHDAHYVFATRTELDVTQEKSVAHWLDARPGDCLINAAAYTAVAHAAQEIEQAMTVNAQAPALLAEACATRGIRFLHVSTDYVFDGKLDRPYREDDATAPLNTYGHSKLIGEQAALAAYDSTIIVRTSWVFSAWGSNFVQTMLQAASEHPILRIVQDQVGGPTWAGHLAAVLHQLALRPAPTVAGGIYHFAGQPWVSWYEFAQEIFAVAQAHGVIGQPPMLEAIRSDQWPTPEPRPANSRLDCHKLEALLGPLAQDWRVGLQQLLQP